MPAFNGLSGSDDPDEASPRTASVETGSSCDERKHEHGGVQGLNDAVLDFILKI